MSPEDAKDGNGTDCEMALLMRTIAAGERDLKSVEFFEDGQNISAQVRALLPTTDAGWIGFRGN